MRVTIAANRSRRKKTNEALPDTLDATEIAMGWVNAGIGGDVAGGLLADQRRLIEAQIAQLGRQRFRDVTIGLFVALLIAGALAFIWTASRAEGVIVQAFAVPSDLERGGLTGPVVAAQLLDKLNTMQEETKSARAASTYADNWGEEIKLEVPYAGVSFGELRRLLRETLGSQTRMSGEIIRLGGNRLALTMRAGRATARVEGSEPDVDRLLNDGARAIYRATQPYRYAAWLGDSPGTAAERRAVLVGLTQSTDLNERLWGYHGLSIDAPTLSEQSSYQARALRLKPDFVPVLGNLPYVAKARGHEEDAYHKEQRAVAAFRSMQTDYDPRRAERYSLTAMAAMATSKGDLLEAAQLQQQAIELPSDTINDLLGPFEAARQWALVHDFGSAKQALADSGLLDPATVAEIERGYGRQTTLPLYYARASGDVALEIRELERLHTALTAELGRTKVNASARIGITASLADLNVALAVAYARSGAAQKAVAAAAATPIDYDSALRARGLAAAAAGEVAQSESWFRRAVGRTPSLPAGYGLWAEARLLRGDYAGAIEQATIAHQKGSRWAEPLRTWGLALLRSGDAAGAVLRFELAAQRAPRWGALNLDWAHALWSADRHKEARSKLVAAGRLSLSAPDRARLEHMTKVAGSGS